MNNKPPRIGGYDWQHARPHAIGVYNAGYSPSGTPLWTGPKPWTVVSPQIFETFTTHAEAITYAFAQVPEKDPTPQERESVTCGWSATQDRLDAWKEKWELTR